MASRIENMDRLRRKVLDRLPAEIKQRMQADNDKSADEFMAGIRRVLKRGDPRDGNLVDTLAKEAGAKDETSVRVSIGGPQPGADHPAHLEFGHRNRDGSHTPGKPFWHPTKRVLQKRHRARVQRNANKGLKALGTKA